MNDVQFSAALVCHSCSHTRVHTTDWNLIQPLQRLRAITS